MVVVGLLHEARVAVCLGVAWARSDTPRGTSNPTKKDTSGAFLGQPARRYSARRVAGLAVRRFFRPARRWSACAGHVPHRRGTFFLEGRGSRTRGAGSPARAPDGRLLGCFRTGEAAGEKGRIIPTAALKGTRELRSPQSIRLRLHTLLIEEGSAGEATTHAGRRAARCHIPRDRAS
jgi:hypothetical protein